MRVCRYLAISHVIRFWCWAQLGLLLPRTVPMLDQCPAQVGGKLYKLGPGRRMFRSSSCRVWPSLAQVGLCSTQCSSYHTPQLPKAIPTQFSFPFPAYIFVHVYVYIYGGCPKLCYPKTALTPRFREPFAPFRAPAESGHGIMIGLSFIYIQTFREPYAALSRPFATAAKHTHPYLQMSLGY